MTPALLGNYSLAFAALAAGSGIVGAIAARRFDSDRALGLARMAVHVVTAMLTAGAIALVYAIFNDDFRLAYVAGYSERALPAGYKLAVFWAGQEGSLLLWAWLMAAMASIATVAGRKDPAKSQAPALGILAAACGFFAVLMLFAANPFRLSEVIPTDGRGLNPMLQDWAMIIHPPMLFLGYAGFTVPFAFGLGALAGGRTDTLWIPSVRRWVLASWLFLTVGIILGAEWAYVELGWGGYWAWDPVENASLLPWFTGTALVHSLIVQQRRGMLKIWNAVLLPLTFVLCIFATYLTRSGVIQSVHAFPKSSLGWFFLAMLAVSLIGSLGVILWRRDILKSDRPLDKFISQEGAFLAGNTLLLIMMLITTIGTLFPLISRLFSKESITLGPEFYNAVILPLAMALLILMGAGPVLRFAAVRGSLRKRLIVPVILTHVAVILAAVLSDRNLWTVLTAGTATFIVACIVDDVVRSLPNMRANLRRWGGQIVHLGIAMILVGVAGSSLYNVKKEWPMHFGQSVEIGRYTLRLDALNEVKRANYTAGEAVMTLTAPGGKQIVLRPQRRRYHKSEQPNTEVAIYMSLREDVYVTLAGWKGEGEITHIQAIVNPLVIWIWIGGIAMGVGALLCTVLRLKTARGREVLTDEAAADVALPVPEAQVPEETRC